MRDFIKETLCELQERAAKDIKNLLDTKTDFTPTEWKSVGEAVDIIKDVEKSIKDAYTSMAMESEYGEEYGVSERGSSYRGGYYPAKGSSYAMNNGRRESYAMGSRRNGSSYAGEMDSAIANLRNMMNNAGSESERMMYQRFIEEAESEKYMR